MRQIERVQSDSDSDCSVRSEDILSSSYPVKPRKTPRWSHLKSQIKGGEHVRDNREIEKALAFINVVKSERRDLFDGECERERIENEEQVKI